MKNAEPVKKWRLCWCCSSRNRNNREPRLCVEGPWCYVWKVRWVAAAIQRGGSGEGSERASSPWRSWYASNGVSLKGVASSRKLILRAGAYPRAQPLFGQTRIMYAHAYLLVYYDPPARKRDCQDILHPSRLFWCAPFSKPPLYRYIFDFVDFPSLRSI